MTYMKKEKPTYQERVEYFREKIKSDLLEHGTYHNDHTGLALNNETVFECMFDTAELVELQKSLFFGEQDLTLAKGLIKDITIAMIADKHCTEEASKQ